MQAPLLLRCISGGIGRLHGRMLWVHPLFRETLDEGDFVVPASTKLRWVWRPFRGLPNVIGVLVAARARCTRAAVLSGSRIVHGDILSLSASTLRRGVVLLPGPGMPYQLEAVRVLVLRSVAPRTRGRRRRSVLCPARPALAWLGRPRRLAIRAGGRRLGIGCPRRNARAWYPI